MPTRHEKITSQIWYYQETPKSLGYTDWPWKWIQIISEHPQYKALWNASKLKVWKSWCMSRYYRKKISIIQKWSKTWKHSSKCQMSSWVTECVGCWKMWKKRSIPGICITVIDFSFFWTKRQREHRDRAKRDLIFRVLDLHS